MPGDRDDDGGPFGDGLPASIRIASDDLPPPFRAPWFRRQPTDRILDSARFAETDDPARLRASGSDAVAAAMISLAEGGLTSFRQDAREAARMVLHFFATGAFRDQSLDAFIGLRRTDGRPSLSMVDKWARRDAQLRELALHEPWQDLSATATAEQIRVGLDRYLAIAWPRERDRAEAPEAMPRSAFWRIASLELHYPLPNSRDLAALISEARSRAAT